MFWWNVSYKWAQIGLFRFHVKFGRLDPVPNFTKWSGTHPTEYERVAVPADFEILTSIYFFDRDN